MNKPRTHTLTLHTLVAQILLGWQLLFPVFPLTYCLDLFPAVFYQAHRAEWPSKDIAPFCSLALLASFMILPFLLSLSYITSVQSTQALDTVPQENCPYSLCKSTDQWQQDHCPNLQHQHNRM